MKRLATEDAHPAMTPEANERRRITSNRRRVEELEWMQAHEAPPNSDYFIAEVLPGLRSVSARAIGRATGLSVSYCAQIQRGERVPHPRWWSAMRNLVPG